MPENSIPFSKLRESEQETLLPNIYMFIVQKVVNGSTILPRTLDEIGLTFGNKPVSVDVKTFVALEPRLLNKWGEEVVTYHPQNFSEIRLKDILPSITHNIQRQ